MQHGAIRKTANAKCRKVEFQLTAEPGCKVFVAGSFNNWDAAQFPMLDNPDSGRFKAKLDLPPGRHEYKFVVNGEWRLDPNCADRVTNGKGSLNSVVAV